MSHSPTIHGWSPRSATRRFPLLAALLLLGCGPDPTPRPRARPVRAPSRLLQLPADLTPDPNRFTFLAFGDSRLEGSLCDPPRKRPKACPASRARPTWGRTICQEAAAHLYDDVIRRLAAPTKGPTGARRGERDYLALFSGDIVHRGSCRKDWAQVKRRFLSRIPLRRLYPILGNHDVWHGKGESRPEPLFFSAFPHLRLRVAGKVIDADYYAFRIGASLFVALDSGGYPRFGDHAAFLRADRQWNSPLASYRTQMTWLSDMLRWAARSGVKHVFVQYHKPSYSNSRHPGLDASQDPLRVLVPFRRAHPGIHVIAISGHNHTTEVYTEGGVLLLVAGGAGAPQYLEERTHRNRRAPPERFWGKRPRTLRYNVFRFVVDGPRVRIEERCLGWDGKRVVVQHGATIHPDGRVTHRRGACQL